MTTLFIIIGIQVLSMLVLRYTYLLYNMVSNQNNYKINNYMLLPIVTQVGIITLILIVIEMLLRPIVIRIWKWLTLD